jgi:hypothetical protein
MVKLKATERLDYFLSDLWDTGTKWVDNINKFLFVTTLIPISIYTVVIIVAGSIFDSTYLPFSDLFLNMSLMWTLISLVTLPILVPIITLILIWAVISIIVLTIFDAIKSALFGNRKD